MIGQTRYDQTSGKHATINKTKMGKKTIEGTLTDNSVDNTPEGGTIILRLVGGG